MIIIDTPSNGWSHLAATTIEELHEFAKSIGLKREWFQDKPGHPHYDLKGTMIDRAKQRGATEVQRKELLKFLRENYID